MRPGSRGPGEVDRERAQDAAAKRCVCVCVCVVDARRARGSESSTGIAAGGGACKSKDVTYVRTYPAELELDAQAIRGRYAFADIDPANLR